LAELKPVLTEIALKVAYEAAFYSINKWQP